MAMLTGLRCFDGCVLRSGCGIIPGLLIRRHCFDGGKGTQFSGDTKGENSRKEFSGHTRVIFPTRRDIIGYVGGLQTFLSSRGCKDIEFFEERALRKIDRWKDEPVQNQHLAETSVIRRRWRKF